jgi:hypothetical protein
VQHTRCCDKRWCRDRMVMATGMEWCSTFSSLDQHVASEFICWRERAQACVTCTVVPMVGFVLVDPGPTTESDSEMRCPASRAAAGTRQQTSTIVTRPIIFAVHPSRLCCSHRQRLQTAPRSGVQLFKCASSKQCARVHTASRQAPPLGGNPNWPLGPVRAFKSVLFRFSLQFRSFGRQF